MTELHQNERKFENVTHMRQGNCTLIIVRGVSLNCIGEGTPRLVLFLARLVLFGQCGMPHTVLHIFDALDVTGDLWNSFFLSCLLSVVYPNSVQGKVKLSL
jgi:hypothetical protein